MIAHRRRRQIWTVTRILLLTILALVVERKGNLKAIENVLDGLRIQYCQEYMPKPTDQLVHLDIDETALEQIGRWPWDRDKLADILEEVRLAEPKVVALDIIFPEPSELKYDEHGKKTDPDAILADELRHFDNVLLPASLTFESGISPDPVDAPLFPLLLANPELSVDECRQRLIQQGIDPKLMHDLDRRCLIVRPRAIYDLIESEMKSGQPKMLELHRKLFPQWDSASMRPIDHLFEEQFDHALRDQAYRRFTVKPQAGLPPVLSAVDAMTPIVPLGKAAKYGSFVDYVPDDVDGKVRIVPLVAEFRGRLLPHMGLAVACAMMDADINDLRLTSTAIIIPRRGMADVVIPVTSLETGDFARIGMFMNIPLFGKKDVWETMYDYPRYQERAQHVSIYEPWRVCQTRRQIASNERKADEPLIEVLPLLDDDDKRKDAYAKVPLRGEQQLAFLKHAVEDMKGLIDGLSSLPEPGEKLQKKLNNLRSHLPMLSEIAKQNDALFEQLRTFRAELHGKLNNRAVFVGGTSTGYVDIVPTALHARCPGVVLHGAIFNAIMTGKMWRVAPHYVTYLIILAFGLITGALVANLSPFRALTAVVALCVGYLAFNGHYLFDKHNLIVGASGPLLAAVLVWSGITVPDFLAEIKERGRITRRFSNYVDPSLVNYVIEHPEQAKFDGEAREMTMGFTDLAGFTTLTESLGTRTIPLLAEYIGKMIPIIRNNQGYVSRLMGDGIYFFFNAPGLDPDHATHAVSTALQMHDAVDQLNLTLPQRGYPLLTLRAGICSGKVIVGDAGSKEFSDYTAMGDAVNTAARLEGANKIFGTRTLVIRRTIELLEGQFLFRPIANLRVAGKTQGVDVFEPLCPLDKATPRQKQSAELSTEVVTKFQAADFPGCLAALDRLDQAFGESKFSSLYRELSREYRMSPPNEFAGQVILTEK